MDYLVLAQYDEPGIDSVYLVRGAKDSKGAEDTVYRYVHRGGDPYQGGSYIATFACGPNIEIEGEHIFVSTLTAGETKC